MKKVLLFIVLGLFCISCENNIYGPDYNDGILEYGDWTLCEISPLDQYNFETEEQCLDWLADIDSYHEDLQFYLTDLDCGCYQWWGE